MLQLTGCVLEKATVEITRCERAFISEYYYISESTTYTTVTIYI